MLAIAGGKGGVGRTTTTLGLAAGIGAEIDGPVLAVDACRELPDLHALGGVDASPGVRAVARGRSVEAVATATPRLGGVRVVPARPGVGRRARRTALERARAGDGQVLVDCPAGVGPDAALPLRLADRAVVVSTPTRRSRRDAAKTVRMARALGTPVVGVLLTRCGSASTERRACGHRVVGTVPESDALRPISDPSVRRAYRRAVTAARCQNA